MTFPRGPDTECQALEAEEAFDPGPSPEPWEFDGSITEGWD